MVIPSIEYSPFIINSVLMSLLDFNLRVYQMQSHPTVRRKQSYSVFLQCCNEQITKLLVVEINWDRSITYTHCQKRILVYTV